MKPKGYDNYLGGSALGPVDQVFLPRSIRVPTLLGTLNNRHGYSTCQESEKHAALHDALARASPDVPRTTQFRKDRGGAAVINAQGGLSWQAVSNRPRDVYIHVLDQQTLNNQIDELLVAG